MLRGDHIRATAVLPSLTRSSSLLHRFLFFLLNSFSLTFALERCWPDLFPMFSVSRSFSLFSFIPLFLFLSLSLLFFAFSSSRTLFFHFLSPSKTIGTLGNDEGLREQKRLMKPYTNNYQMVALEPSPSKHESTTVGTNKKKGKKSVPFILQWLLSNNRWKRVCEGWTRAGWPGLGAKPGTSRELRFRCNSVL